MMCISPVNCKITTPDAKIMKHPKSDSSVASGQRNCLPITLPVKVHNKSSKLKKQAVYALCLKKLFNLYHDYQKPFISIDQGFQCIRSRTNLGLDPPNPPY